MNAPVKSPVDDDHHHVRLELKHASCRLQLACVELEWLDICLAREAIASSAALAELDTIMDDLAGVRP